MTIKRSSLYAYYVKNHNAIKVGYGDKSKERLRDYARQYHLIVDLNTLQDWEIPVASLAQTIENECHNALLEAGFEKLFLNVEGQIAQELFHLHDQPYEEALLIVAGTIDETIQKIHLKLTQKVSSLTNESTRQKKEENKQRIQKLKEIKQQELDEEVGLCAAYYKSVWGSIFQPGIENRKQAEKIKESYFCRGGSLKRLFSKIDRNASPALSLYRWKEYPLMRSCIKKIFESDRIAKNCHIQTLLKYDKDKKGIVGLAIKSIDFPPDSNYFCVGDNYIRSLSFCVHCMGYRKGLSFCHDPLGYRKAAEMEVRLVVQTATGFGGDDATELINLDPELKDLIEYAKVNTPSEIGTEFFRYYTK
jgi:hypothetical protein